MPAQGSDLSADPLLAGVPVQEGHKVLGGVVLYQKLGQGGMGAVYRGKHLRLNIDAAVKILAPPAGMPTDQTESFVKRFMREAQSAASVNHPNLIRVYDVNTECGLHYIIMDFVDGGSAGERLKRKGVLTEAEAAEMCLGAAQGLAEAHREGIIHRDVKPDNVLIEKTGDVVVADLGLAKAYSDERDGGEPSKLTRTQAVLGTPYYMAPEQFASAADLGPAADVWSLGVTLYELLTGKRPWTDDNVFALAEKIRDDPPPDLEDLSPGLSDGICRIIEKALRKNPQERYADCGQMANVLREHVRTLPRSKARSSRQTARSIRPVVASVTPPDPETMSLIGKSGVGSEAMPRPAGKDVPAAPPVQEELLDVHKLPLAPRAERLDSERRKEQVRKKQALISAKSSSIRCAFCEKVIAAWTASTVTDGHICRECYDGGLTLTALPSRIGDEVGRVFGTMPEEPDMKDAVDYCRRGEWRWSEGDPDGAIQDFDRAIELDPTCSEAYWSRGLAREAKGDYDDAMRDYERCIGVDFS